MRNIILFLFWLFAVTVQGAIWNSPTAGQNDVSNTVNLASSGDTINIPSGTATWTGTLTVNKWLSFVGAGTNSTVITIATDNSAHQSSEYAGLVLQGNGYNQVSGIQFVGLGGYTAFPAITCWSGQALRIYNCVFKNCRQGVHTGGPFGVIDHCYFENCRGAIQIFGNGNGQVNWDSYYPIPYTSTNYLFVEDCSFRVGNAIRSLWADNSCAIVSSGQGASYVARYNTILADGDALLTPVFDWHGDSNDGTRGSLSVQAYQNTVTIVGGSARVNVYATPRGGQSLIYSNTVTAPSSYQAGYGIEEWEEYPTGTLVGGVRVYDYVTNQWQWANKTIVGTVTNSMTSFCSGNPGSAPSGCGMLNYNNATYTGSYAQPYPHPLVSAAPSVFGQIRMFGTTASLVEDQVSATLYVRRTNGTDGAVGVTARTVDQTATAPLYYGSVTTNLTWAAGETGYKTFDVPLVNIPTNGTHTFLVYLTNATGGATITTPSQTIVSITGTAAASTQVVYWASSTSSAGASGNLTNYVTRTNGSTGTVTVNYATVNGSALAGTDYVSTNGTLTFTAGVTNLPVVVPITWQSQLTNRIFTIALSSPTGASLVAPGTNTVTLLPGPPLYSIAVRASGLSQSVVVTNTPPDNQGATLGPTPFSLLFTGGGTNAVALTAPATVAVTNVFSQWLQDNLFATTNRTVIVPLDSNHTVTAVYVATAAPPSIATITVTSVPSDVTVNNSPSDKNGSVGGNTPFTLTFNAGTNVTYGANQLINNGAYTFSKWQTNNVDAGTGLSMSAVAQDGLLVKAVYVPTPAFTLSVQSTNPAANVFISTFPTATNGAAFGTTPYVLPYYANTTVSLTAPALAGTNVFENWMLDNGQTSPNQTATLLMNGNHTMKAIYGPPTASSVELYNVTLLNAVLPEAQGFASSLFEAPELPKSQVYVVPSPSLDPFAMPRSLLEMPTPGPGTGPSLLAAPAPMQYTQYTTNKPGQVFTQPATYATGGDISIIANGLISTTNQANGRLNVRSFGAKGDGITDDFPAFQAALNAVQGSPTYVTGGAIYVPRGIYKISSSLTVTAAVNHVEIYGDAAVLQSTNINPMLTFMSQAGNIIIKGIHFLGNGTNGVGGSGHGLVFQNNAAGAGTSTFWPQQIDIENCVFEGFKGTGLDAGGATIPACGIYAYGGLGMNLRACNFSSNSTGLKVEQYFEVRASSITASLCTYNGIYFRGVTDGSISQSTLVGCGSGGATDGGFYTANSARISLAHCYAKNGNPYVLNFTGNTIINDTVAVKDCTLMQIDTTMTPNIVGVGTSVANFAIEDCYFLAYYAWTNAVGIVFTGGPGNYSTLSPLIRNCQFLIGDGGHYKACIWFNPTPPYSVISPTIENCVFGGIAVHGLPTYYESAIRMEQNVTSPTIRGCSFIAGSGTIISNVCNIIGSGVTGPVWSQNNALNLGGTLVNSMPNTNNIIVLQDGQITTKSLVSNGAATINGNLTSVGFQNTGFMSSSGAAVFGANGNVQLYDDANTSISQTPNKTWGWYNATSNMFAMTLGPLGDLQSGSSMTAPRMNVGNYYQFNGVNGTTTTPTIYGVGTNYIPVIQGGIITAFNTSPNGFTGGGGSAPNGTVVTNGTGVSGDIMAFGAGGTNAAKATAANLTNAIGTAFDSRYAAAGASGGTNLDNLTVTNATMLRGNVGIGGSGGLVLTNGPLSVTNALIGANLGITVNNAPAILNAGLNVAAGGATFNGAAAHKFSAFTSPGVLTTVGTLGQVSQVSAFNGAIVYGDGTTIMTNGLLGAIGGQPTNATLTTLASSPGILTEFIPVPVFPSATPGSGTAAYNSTATSDTKLQFGTNYVAQWQFLLPSNYNSNLVFKGMWNMETATSSSVPITAKIWKLTTGATASMGTENFSTANTVTTTSPGTARWPFLVSITMTNTGGLAAGDWFQLQVSVAQAAGAGFANFAGGNLEYNAK